VLFRTHTRSALARREASPELQAAPAEDEDEEDEDESEWETDTDDDDAPGRKMVKPMFVPKARGARAPLRGARTHAPCACERNPKPNAHAQVRSMRCKGAGCRADARARLRVWRLRVRASAPLRPCVACASRD
jgi:hypothetical protein